MKRKPQTLEQLCAARQFPFSVCAVADYDNSQPATIPLPLGAVLTISSFEIINGKLSCFYAFYEGEEITVKDSKRWAFIDKVRFK